MRLLQQAHATLPLLKSSLQTFISRKPPPTLPGQLSFNYSLPQLYTQLHHYRIKEKKKKRKKRKKRKKKPSPDCQIDETYKITCTSNLTPTFHPDPTLTDRHRNLGFSSPT
jgi:hypothetical protein